jgi:ketosteroid isomerase-like protein
LAKPNLEIVQAAFGVSPARAEAIRPLFADDFSCHVAAGLPYGGEYRGWEGYLALLANIGAFWSELRLNDQEFLPLDDNRVLIRFDLDGRIARTRRRVRMPVVAIWELRNGQVSKITIFYFDTKAVADAAAP